MMSDDGALHLIGVVDDRQSSKRKRRIERRREKGM
jgi:hypothetical protein